MTERTKIEIPLNIVESHELLKNKGDAIIVTGNNLLTQLIIVCPGCGRISASKGNHVYDRYSKSYTPSIVHDMKLGGCGWHGWLTDGIFREC